MNYCEHCQGQRFDRARILRVLRQLRKDVRKKARGNNADEALVLALAAIRSLEIPHLELEEEEDQVVH